MIDKKKLFIILVIGGFGLLFFTLVLISAFTSTPDDQSAITPTPTPFDLIIPTNSSNLDTSNSDPSSLMQLVSIEPQDTSIVLTPISQLSFTFSEAINERKFFYKISPQSPSFINAQGATVTITPKEVWPVGRNTITVYAETESINGKRLSTQFTHQFTVEEIPFPDEELEE